MTRYKKRKVREACCYACGDNLSSEDNEECENCEWLVCGCGQCGCDYDG